MSYLKDYEEIRTIIDDIIGIETQVGSNLKTAIKKYFEMKPISVKLVSPKVGIEPLNRVSKSKKMEGISKEADEALNRYNEKLSKNLLKLKKKGEYCGVSG